MLQYLQVGNKTVSVGGEGGEARVCMERWVWYCVHFCCDLSCLLPVIGQLELISASSANHRRQTA